MKAYSGIVLQRPSTLFGWWAVGLATTFVVLISITAIMAMIVQAYETGSQAQAFNVGIPTVLCGLAAGMVGRIAVIRQHERSWLVWLALLPGFVSIVLLIYDLLVAL